MSLKKLLLRLTGGRPMYCVSHAFDDKVTGHAVFNYVDGFGRFWLAETAWSWFRVRKSSPPCGPVPERSKQP